MTKHPLEYESNEVREMERLQSINAELLAALEALHGHLQAGDNCTAIMTEITRAAIAKAGKE